MKKLWDHKWNIIGYGILLGLCILAWWSLAGAEEKPRVHTLEMHTDDTIYHFIPDESRRTPEKDWRRYLKEPKKDCPCEDRIKALEDRVKVLEDNQIDWGSGITGFHEWDKVIIQENHSVLDKEDRAYRRQLADEYEKSLKDSGLRIMGEKFPFAD